MVTLTAVTVRPALVEPTPLVNTDRGINFAENFKNCDFAVPMCQCVTMTGLGVEVTHYTWITNQQQMRFPSDMITTCYSSLLHGYHITIVTN